MPKKSSHKKSTVRRTPSRHFLWSIFFMAMVASVNIYFVGVERALGNSYTWPLVAVLLSAITIVTVGYERKTGKLGTGTFLWSIVFAAILVGVTIYFLNMVGSSTWTVISAGSAAVGLILLIYEKFNYK